MVKRDFPLAPLERIARKAGATRISESALKALRDCVLEIAEEIAADAVVAARHAKRITLKKEDIKLVSR